MRSTSCPSCAKFFASATAVLDFPSPGRALVMRSVFGAPSAVENCSAVLSDRYASESDDLGSWKASANMAASSEIGMIPSTGRPRLVSTSSGILNELSRNSIPKARKPAAEEPERQSKNEVLGEPRLHRRAGQLGGIDD